MIKESSLQLIAPLTGISVSIENVPDPVFAQKIVGNGIAIDPTSQILVAPCAGKIIQIHPSLHAISIATESGAQILLHIGLDTVKLKGEGFRVKVKVGDLVQQGQELIHFDADLVAQKAKSLISMMIIAEAPPHHMQTVSTKKQVQAGKDVLLQLNFTIGRLEETKPSEHSRSESPPVTIRLPSGVHARPAALLVGMAKKYSSQIEMRTDSGSANAKSVVGLLGLNMAFGNVVRFVAVGPDANAATAELARFLSELTEAAAPLSAAKAPIATTPKPGSESVITGSTASPGLAIGRVHQLRADPFDIPEKADSAAAEKASLAKALNNATAELQTLRQQVKSQTDAAQSAIFSAHQELLADPDLLQLATGLIEQGKSAAFAWNQATLTHADRLSQLKNELMAHRASDLKDIGRRVLRLLLGNPGQSLLTLSADTILIAENLIPSDTVQLDRGKVLGFCTITGGATSHVAILARSLGLPALAGVERRALELPEGTEIVLDGDRGEIRLNPSEEEKARIRSLQEQQLESHRQALLNSSQPAATQDGHQIGVGANIGGVADARKALEMGCDGIGLLRSEFLFLQRSTPPSEDEQYQVYQEIADIMGTRPLVIRTLDVGGDKPLQYLPIPHEDNPFLGVRGIRVGLLKPEIMREQLRAILRVKSRGTLHIMFPMVATLEEFRWAKSLVNEERARLGAPPVKIGIMIEVPSAALIAEAFAPEVDFFSIGTNDLTQYTMAMDRGHTELAKQLDGLHPSVLKLIDMTVQAAHRHGKWVGVCGGIASEAQAIPLLLGMGVDELSVSIHAVPLVKSQVRSLNLDESKALAQRALDLSSAKDVRDLSTRI